MNAPVDGIICDLTSLPSEERDVLSRFDVPVVTHVELENPGLFLSFQDHCWMLRQGGKKAPGPVYVDFVKGASAHRRKFGGGKGQSIAKAVGISSYKPTVFDATAGLGGDGFVLATLGCSVTMAERHPVVFTLLENGLKRARESDDSDVRDIADRMQLLQGSSVGIMESWKGGVPDVIYLDPMFPHSRSSAEAKKEMKLFREMVGPDNDEAALWHSAYSLARCRIAVKRPRHAPPLAEQVPDYDLAGKANRFDIYTKQKVAAPAEA